MGSDSAGCPYQGQSSNTEAFNCDTNLPNENVLQKPSTEDESARLAADRTASSIPRSDSQQNGTWLYPSPRMFYNALKRKGHETRPEDIHSMLQVHNFLNEQVWEQVLQWEASYKSICGEPKLKRFMGRPQDLSPKARLCGWLFGTPRPFDRHDWTIDRCGRDVRYVIDYYSGPSSDEGAFFVDVRPAADSFSAVWDRLKRWIQEKQQQQ